MNPSIGDCVSVAALALKVLKAFSSCRGSKHQFRSLTNTLRALSQVLWHADQLCGEFPTCPFSDDYNDPCRLQGLDSIVLDIAKERRQCEKSIENFYKDFQSYADAFGQEDASKVYQSIKKITWMNRKEDIEAFEKQLDKHLQALQMLLLMFCQ
jgi:hypothetical protein